MKTYTIRPLEWEGSDPVWEPLGPPYAERYGASKGLLRASVAGLGDYTVSASCECYITEYFFEEYHDEGTLGTSTTIAAAKELAWQDWLRRITPALEEVE